MGQASGGLVKKINDSHLNFLILISIRDIIASLLFILKLLSVLYSSVLNLERFIKGVLNLALSFKKKKTVCDYLLNLSELQGTINCFIFFFICGFDMKINN